MLSTFYVSPPPYLAHLIPELDIPPMILVLLLTLLAKGVSGRRLVHANVRTALHAVKESYYFGSRSQSPATAHKPLYVAPSTIDIESSVRYAGRAARNPSQPSALTSETLRERSAAHQTEKRYSGATERSPTRADYSFGARLPRRGESVSQRASVDVRSRVEEQPSESSWSRPLAEGRIRITSRSLSDDVQPASVPNPEKVNYSFGARLPKRAGSSSPVIQGQSRLNTVMKAGTMTKGAFSLNDRRGGDVNSPKEPKSNWTSSLRAGARALGHQLKVLVLLTTLVLISAQRSVF